MSEEAVVERIEHNDPPWLKWFFVLFFLFLPVTGLLLFWNDGHHKIKVSAEKFTSSVVIPAFKEPNESTFLELATPGMADKLREGEYQKLQSEFGPLKSFSDLSAEKTRAREEEDQGVVYAEVLFKGKFAKQDGRVRMTIRRLSMGEYDPKIGHNRDVWLIDRLEVHPR